MAAQPGKEPTAVHSDTRGHGRALRVTWHLDREQDGRPEPLVVLSLWRDNVCAGSFRLRREEVPGLVAFLAGGLDVLERRAVAAGLAEAEASNEGSTDLHGHADAG